MTGADGETVVYELPVFTKKRSFLDFINSVSVIIEQGVTDMLHVHPDLVGPTRLQDALDQGDIAKSFQDFIVGNGFFSVISFGIGVKQLAKAQVSAYVRHDGPA